MTPKEKAEEIVCKIINMQYSDDRTKMIFISSPKIALFVIDEITSALTEYGEESMELQNMESEFRYWDRVKHEIIFL